ncbi:MAG TPA: hypothetical protein VNT75_26825 [Symbiobacteriaceae bacterium]|nr:hypothetical protein [Symbiobacteriaceae bacterium]
MRYRADSEVLVTTVVVKGPVSPLQAELQHRAITQAVMAGVSRRRVKEPPRIIYLVLSLLLLAGAVFFFYLAVK